MLKSAPACCLSLLHTLSPFSLSPSLSLLLSVFSLSTFCLFALLSALSQPSFYSPLSSNGEESYAAYRGM
jgi:hypothetical protein